MTMHHILAVVVALATGSAALAHSELRRTSPAANAVLAESPREIVLEFNERVQVTTLRVTAGGGDTVRLAPASLGQAASTERVALPAPLAPGRWRIEWAAISADGHPITGQVPFEVRGSR